MADRTEKSYFYGANGADEFSFFRIPKLLVISEEYAELSIDAKFLYGLLLDRMSLSVRNNWIDEQNRVYIIFTTEAVMEVLHCADKKATAIMQELEQCGLIERKRQGFGKPNLVYVKRFVEQPAGEFSDTLNKNRENHESRIVKITNQESSKSRCNNTEYNKTEILSPYGDSNKKESKRARKPFVPPTVEEVRAYINEKGLAVDPVAFVDYFEAGEWFDSEGKPVLNWKQRVQTWSRMHEERKTQRRSSFQSSKPFTYDYSDTEGSL